MNRDKEDLIMRTLLLDNTFFPVRIISWQKAMILWLTGRAEVVDIYSEIDIRSSSESFKLPKILRLYNRHRTIKEVKFCRFNVFYRDRFQCQYCGDSFNHKELTFDHVVPQSRGGKTTWTNIVTACNECNSRKGNKLPKEAGMFPMTKPFIPKWTPQLCLRLKKDDPQEWWAWFPGKKVSLAG